MSVDDEHKVEVNGLRIGLFWQQVSSGRASAFIS